MAMRQLSGDVGEASLPATLRSDNAGSVKEVIAGLADLDANGLRLQWRAVSEQILGPSRLC